MQVYITSSYEIQHNYMMSLLWPHKIVLFTSLSQAKINAKQIYKAFTFNYFKYMYFESFLVDQ